jgi:hypothetical protein
MAVTVPGYTLAGMDELQAVEGHFLAVLRISADHPVSGYAPGVNC